MVKKLAGPGILPTWRKWTIYIMSVAPIPKNGYAKKLLPLSDGRIIVIKTNFNFTIYNPGFFGTEGKFSDNLSVFEPTGGQIVDGTEYSKGLVAFALSDGRLKLMDFRNKNKPTSIGYFITTESRLGSIELLKDGRFVTSSSGQVQIWTLANGSVISSFHADFYKNPGFILDVRQLSDGRLVAHTSLGFFIIEKDGSGLFEVTEFNNSYSHLHKIWVQKNGFYLTDLGRDDYETHRAFLDLWRTNNLNKGNQP